MDGAQSQGDGLLAGWLTRAEVAEQFGIKVDTLRRWDSKRIGPPFVKLGARVLYRREAVRDWLREQEAKS